MGDEASVEKLEAALDLMQRMPPAKIEHSLSGLLNLVPEETDDLLQRIDQPLQTEMDPENGKQFLLCDYNRDGDSYRSPWSNKYVAQEGGDDIQDGLTPSEQLRSLEVLVNDIFALYVDQYYGKTALSSVYCWDLDDGDGFASCWLVKKSAEAAGYTKSGNWDSIHVMEAKKRPQGGNAYTYRLTSTVMIQLDASGDKLGNVNLSGSLIRQAEKNLTAADNQGHLENMGGMIESMENDLKGTTTQIYMGKTNEVLSAIHSRSGGPGGMLVGLANKAAAHAK